MKNFIQEGDEFAVTLTAAVVAGDVTLDGVLPAVAFSDGAIGDLTTAKSNGVFRLTTDGTSTFAVGAAVYWDPLANVATDVPTATTATNVDIGLAFAAVTAGASVEVLLNGLPA